MLTNTQQSMLRELLTATGGALVAYGVGTTGLWEEVSGGVLALVMLIWAIKSNTGREQWITLGRKTLSAVGGVLLTTGTLDASKVDVLLGLASTFMSLGWTLLKLPTPDSPQDNEAGPNT